MSEPKVTPDGLKSGYWDDLITRTQTAVNKIQARSQMTANGAVVPDDADLVIGEGRHLPAAILFTDISGFSAWPSSDQAEQSDVLTTLNLYMSEAVRIIRDYGGEVEKNTGDGFLAYFDVQPGEEEATTCKRALGCVLTMKASAEYLINPVLARSSLPTVRFRAAVDFGWITVAKIGAAQLFNSRVAIGSAANVTGKMLGHGGDEDIVIGANLNSRLPLGWASHSEFLTAASGFFYVLSGVPYPLYRYKGRWTRLV